MPLYNRDYGMGIVTSVNWFWNWFIAQTWPWFNATFTTSGAFAWYAIWCFVGWWMILLFVPETKGLTLEQLGKCTRNRNFVKIETAVNLNLRIDQVFDCDVKVHMRHGMEEFRWIIRRYVIGNRQLKKPILIRNKDPQEIIDMRGEPFNTHEEID
jgi:hypothetical protein